MSYRAIYRKVRNHLLTQNKRAYDSACRYLANDGSKCAIGCLIPFDLYHENMEGKLVESLFPDLSDEKLSFLGHLQDIHDQVLPEKWEKELNHFKEKYNV